MRTVLILALAVVVKDFMSNKRVPASCWGFPGSLVVKNPPAKKKKESSCQAGDTRSIPGPGRSPEEENGNLLQYSCLGNAVDRGVWQAAVHGVAKSRTGPRG